jgi:hypothetical protein
MSQSTPDRNASIPSGAGGRPRLAFTRRSFLKLSGALAVLAGGLPRILGAVDRALGSSAATRGYPYQLHLHAHSSHATAASSVQPGVLPAMEAQSYLASSFGVNNLWWSEHDHSFPQSFTWTTGVFNPPRRVGQGGQSKMVISPITRIPVPNTNRSSPPMYAIPEITIEYKRGSLEGTRRINMFIQLAWHYRDDSPNPQPERDKIHIQFRSGDDFAPVKNSSNVVFRRMNLPPRNFFRKEVIPLDPGFYLTSPDNLIGAIEIQPTSNTWIDIRSISVRCLDGSRESVLAARRDLAEQNSVTYGTTEYVGVEHSAGARSNPAVIQIQAITGPAHVNLFLPSDPDVGQAQHSPFLDVLLTPQEYSDYAHENGGVASLNHPFGTGPASSASHPEEVTQVGNFLLDNDIYGADLLEVGYLRGRGQVSFPDHIRLWDVLLANLNYLVNPRLIGGIAVSDAHGAAPTGEAHPFCTWLVPDQASAPMRSEAVELLRRRRMFFGPYASAAGLFQAFPATGLFDFSISGTALTLQMGEEGDIDTDLNDEAELTVNLAPAGMQPPNTVLKLIELPVIPGGGEPDATFAATVQQIGLTHTVTIDVEKIFRLELWTAGASSVPIAFSNPILARPLLSLQGEEEPTPSPTVTPTETATETPTPEPTATATPTADESEADDAEGR